LTQCFVDNSSVTGIMDVLFGRAFIWYATVKKCSPKKECSTQSGIVDNNSYAECMSWLISIEYSEVWCLASGWLFFCSTTSFLCPAKWQNTEINEPNPQHNTKSVSKTNIDYYCSVGY
jgi:hypothetical protein